VVIGILASAGALGWWLTSRWEGQYFENEGTRLFFSDERTGVFHTLWVKVMTGYLSNGPAHAAMVGVVPFHAVVYIEGADHMAAVGSLILLESLQECLVAYPISQ
jgi:hypothetical protein